MSRTRSGSDTSALVRGDKLLRHWVRERRRNALGVVAAAAVVFVAGLLAYRAWAPGGAAVVKAELTGSPEGIRNYVGDGGGALWADYGLIAAYAIAVIAANLVGRSLSVTDTGRRLSTAAVFATIVAALCDVAANETLRPVVRGDEQGQNALAVAAQALSFTKWTLILPAAAVAVAASLAVLWRALGVPLSDRWQRARHRGQGDPGNGAVDVEWPAVDEDNATLDDKAIAHAAWRANSRLPDDHARPRRSGIGICVSGGGIRAATFTLGALDSLRSVLCRASYLVSVSGGGYATGAMQLALQKLRAETVLTDGLSPETSASAARPGDVYTGGSPELNHTRRHGKYLAESAAEWVSAVVHVLRGLLVNLITLGLVLVVTGRVLAHAYAYLPGDLLREGTWPPPEGVSWAVGSTFGLALVLWLVQVWASGLRHRLRWVSSGAAGLGVLLAVAGIGLPLLAWAARAPQQYGTATAASQGFSLLAAWVAALVTLGKRPAVRKDVARLHEQWTKASPKQRSLVANLLVATGFLLILASLLLLFGIVLTTTGGLTAASTWPGGGAEWQYTLGAALLLAFFATVDQAHWSLHPFYRRRLATAFSVRRVRDGRRVRAVPYDFDAEQTRLHDYAARDDDFPQVIFSCAAHASDRRVTNPGRRVVPWRMSGDYIGSPMIGWIPTRQLYEAVSETIKDDLTVQAAQAISGAAIASQMGRMNRIYTRLLALTNARLGSWLPNPAYLKKRSAENNAWWLPRLPRRRYLATLGRELTGSFPGDGPLLYVTDGGHYENLGLVELLRHRCTFVYCIDGSGDRPDVATTLAQAIELAYEELGVTITLDRPGALGAGAESPHRTAPDVLIGKLQSRLAQSSVVTGRILYPDLGPGLPERQGLLILGKATLTAQTPFDLLAHAARNPSFPNDTTADQWFDHEQFDAYHGLGRYVGEAMQQLGAYHTRHYSATGEVAGRTTVPPTIGA